MTVNKYKGTINVFKKSDYVDLALINGIVTVINGHTVLQVSKNFYDSFLSGKAPCFPAIVAESIHLRYQNKKLSENSLDSCFKIDPFIKDIKGLEAFKVSKSPLSLNCDDKFANCFFWNANGKVAGACFNSTYVDMITEFSHEINCTGEKSPAYFENDSTFVAILPINNADLKELIKSMNAEIELRKTISQLQRDKSELERALYNYKEVDRCEIIKGNFKKGLITMSECVESLKDEILA